MGTEDLEEQNIPSTVIPPIAAWIVDTRQYGVMFLYCLAKFWHSHPHVAAETSKTTFSQFSVVEFVWACTNYSIRFLSLADRSGTCCGTIRDALLRTLVLTNGYFNYCLLLMSSKQTGHFPLASTRHYSPESCHSLDHSL